LYPSREEKERKKMMKLQDECSTCKDGENLTLYLLLLDGKGKEKAMREIDWLSCPPNSQGGLERYYKDHIEPGGFLRAVLENDLFEAFGRADEENRVGLFYLCSWIYNNLPSASYGSREAVKLWLAKREDPSNA
jgi:hypothetical protein